MNVIVYVEGPSDKLAMEALLRPLLDEKQQKGVTILFREASKGDKKKSLLMKEPRRAANIIMNNPSAFIVIMPDLYPKNKAFRHTTVDELRNGILLQFEQALASRNRADDPRLRERFNVFCFKYDLEALLLAAENALKNRLGVNHLKVSWKIPVEDQDHDNPPKRIVEDLFESHGTPYVPTVDAPLVLGASNLQDITTRCPQCFKPFVEFLTGLHTG
jgi:hypothetical protein